MELSQVNKGFTNDDGKPIEQGTDEKETRSVRSSGSGSSPGLNYDHILDEIGQFGRY